jgi:hypothetical protein
MAGIKLLNAYAEAVNVPFVRRLMTAEEQAARPRDSTVYVTEQHGDDLYAAIPKAVWAALAVSYASNGGDRVNDTDFLRDAILREWWILHNNGIVPQRPHLPDPGRD